MAKKGQELAVADDKQLQEVASVYHTEGKGLTINFPRIGVMAQDDEDDKKFKAGTFYIERKSDQTDKKTGKPIFEKEVIDDGVEVKIFYKRHQLKYFDGKNFVNSPIYDLPDETIPLFSKGEEVHRGTPAELRAEYEYKDPQTKKTKTLLQDVRILYVLYEGEVYQMNMQGSHMYALLNYEKTVNPTTVVTELSSKEMSKGKNEWNVMTFTNQRKLTKAEADEVREAQISLIEKISEQKAGFESAEEKPKKDKDDF